ncbi:hypothetical protein HOT99_gp238 [Caulobacter phage CcrBL10]|uniref:Uncharacterized protein n=1 Tax=Caulobacter phage CcrBL10 TaxID=2283269 RepID=A0A385ECF7_9CAUD|nr:hypothetical protein HOT99_gp238 [Caulobacter phage CcrBL10]AXQ68379.1 hypothetical protein CcrBL10_gp175c [Caulobacter phage CcrBL10]
MTAAQTKLAVVTTGDEITTAQRIAALQSEALSLADVLIRDTLIDLKAVSDRLHEIGQCKIGVPAGIKERTDRLSEHILKEIEQIVALKQRGLAS